MVTFNYCYFFYLVSRSMLDKQYNCVYSLKTHSFTIIYPYIWMSLLSHCQYFSSSRKMPHGSDDVRKKFILTTTGNFYGLKPSSSLTDSPELNNFLDDGNEFVLSVSRHDNDLRLSNKVSFLKKKKKVIKRVTLHIDSC